MLFVNGVVWIMLSSFYVTSAKKVLTSFSLI